MKVNVHIVNSSILPVEIQNATVHLILSHTGDGLLNLCLKCVLYLTEIALSV